MGVSHRPPSRMHCKDILLLLCLTGSSLSFNIQQPLYSNWLGPRPFSPVAPLLYKSLPAINHQTSLSLQQTRVICGRCNCDDDFFCAFNCPSCSSDDFCSSCTCTTSLGCARNCQQCFPAADPGLLDPPSPPEDGCIASGGPAEGRDCIFPFTYQGVKYHGCAPLPQGGLINLYSAPVTWCSTRVDVNGFHIRGPWDDLGRYVGYCDDTCPKVAFFY